MAANRMPLRNDCVRLPRVRELLWNFRVTPQECQRFCRSLPRTSRPLIGTASDRVRLHCANFSVEGREHCNALPKDATKHRWQAARKEDAAGDGTSMLLPRAIGEAFFRGCFWGRSA